MIFANDQDVVFRIYKNSYKSVRKDNRRQIEKWARLDFRKEKWPINTRKWMLNLIKSQGKVN